MTHHLAHAEDHEPQHRHFVCPECYGQGFVDRAPDSEQEESALRRYEEGLKREIKAVEDRLRDLK